MPAKRPDDGERTLFIDAFMHGSILFGYAAVMGIADVSLIVIAGYLAAIQIVHLLRLRSRPPFVSERFVVWSMLGVVLFTLLTAVKSSWQTPTIVSAYAHGVILVGFLALVSRMSLKERFRIMSTLSIMLFFFSALFVRPPEFLLLLWAQTVSTLALAFAVPHHGRIPCPIVAIAQPFVVTALAIAVFIALPRFDRAASPRPRQEAPVDASRDGQGSTGVTTEDSTSTSVGIPPRIDAMSIRNFRGLLGNRSIAARVTFSGDNLENTLRIPCYLRAVTYDTYDNGAWSAPAARRRIDDAADGSEDGTVVIRRSLPDHGRLVHQRIVPSFALGRTVLSIPDPVRFHFPSVMSDNAGLFLFPPMTDATRPYETDALPPTFPEDEMATVTRSVASPRTLRTPPGLDDIRAIAGRVTEGCSTVMEKIRALREYLANNCRYDLAAVDETGLDPVREFLTVRRTGYCVHFASAMTVMLRQIGIPALVAGGFLCHERSGGNWEFVVRNSDAHMWTEVYFEGMGWMIVDATPPDGLAASAPPEIDEPEETRRATPATEAGGWSDPMTEFGAKARDAILSTIGKAFNDMLPAAGNIFMAAWPFAIGAIALIVLATFVMPRAGKSRIIAAVRKIPIYSRIPFYNDYLWILYRRGFVRSSTQTPREFSRSLPAAIPADAVAVIASAYERVNYGHAVLTPGELEEIRSSLRRIGRRE